MKPKIIFSLLIFLSIVFLSCSDTVDNRVTFLNYAGADVYVNFKADLVHISPSVPPNEEGLLEIPPGEKVDINEIFKGEYEYETIYEVPAGATSSSVEGEGAGTLKLNAGTKILVVYTSTYVDSAYTLYVSITTSEDQTEGILPNPIGP